MGLFGRIEDKTGVDDPDYAPPPPDSEVEPNEPETITTANPVGIALAALGGVLVALAAFLPLNEPSSAFVRVESNSLIQHEGWWLIVLGALIVLVAVTVRKRAVWVCVLAVLAGAAVVHFGSDKELRTLYPIGTNGEPNPEANGTVVPLGVAVYVAGVGAALAFVGGWVMTRGRRAVTSTPERATKDCPDCAETILAEAQVCKHCGYRFGSPDTAEAVRTGPVRPLSESDT